MRWNILALALLTGCATQGFHPGKTSLANNEQGYLLNERAVSTKGPFLKFWRSPHSKKIGLIKWDEARSFADPSAPKELLQAIRDELGRLNQNAEDGEPISLAVTVYRYVKGGFWTSSESHYELVARDPKNRIAWLAEDKVSASEGSATSLADTESVLIAREILRKAQMVLGNKN